MDPDWLKFFRELGFPAAVAFFVLWRLDQTLHEILRELAALRQTLATLGGTMGAATITSGAPRLEGHERRAR